MINNGSNIELIWKAFCIDFKLYKCLSHRKIYAKISITIRPVAFLFWYIISQLKKAFCQQKGFLNVEGVFV